MEKELAMPERLTPHRRIILEQIAAGTLQIPSRKANARPAFIRATDALAGATLIRWTVHGWAITSAGKAALATPYGSQNEAMDACDRWRKAGGGLGRTVVGWAAARCRGGGFAIRVGFTKGPPQLLPVGIDKELLR